MSYMERLKFVFQKTSVGWLVGDVLSDTQDPHTKYKNNIKPPTTPLMIWLKNKTTAAMTTRSNEFGGGGKHALVRKYPPLF